MENNILFNVPCDRKNREIIIGGLLMNYGFLSRETIGESRCSRAIDMLCIGNRGEQVLLAGAFHGMEWITSCILLRFLGEVSEAVKNGQCLCGIRIGTFLNRRGLAVIPCVNPDGVEIQIHGSDAGGKYSEMIQNVSKGDTSRWQANAIGVDINHNFDAHWEKLHELERESGIIGASPTRYGGEFAESEPESRAIASYCRTGHIAHAIAFHSQGEEIYWSYGDYHSDDALRMAKAMSEVSGYTVSEPTGLAVGGGFKDWFEQKFRRPAFTVEAGKGTNPLPLSDFGSIYEKIKELLVISLIL